MPFLYSPLSHINSAAFQIKSEKQNKEFKRLCEVSYCACAHYNKKTRRGRVVIAVRNNPSCLLCFVALNDKASFLPHCLISASDMICLISCFLSKELHRASKWSHKDEMSEYMWYIILIYIILILSELWSRPKFSH